MENESDMDQSNGDASELSAEGVTALTVAQYDKILNHMKTIKARLLLLEANTTGSTLPNANGVQFASDVSRHLSQLEEEIQRLSIQEDMLKQVKVSKLTLELLSSGEPILPQNISELLKQHVANQARLTELSKSIQKEQSTLLAAKDQHFLHHFEYLKTLDSEHDRLKDIPEANGSYDQKTMSLQKKLDKHVKDIRFMQICISHLILHKRVDLRENSTLRHILTSARDPVTSIDDIV